MEKILLVLTASILSALPIILIKKYILSRKQYFITILVAIALNVIVTYLYIPLLEISNATIIYTIIKVLSVIIIAFLAFIYLKERLTIRQIIGVTIGMISLMLLTI
jgi:drug/metabolite transporter (DMT)-like permease